LSRVVAPIQNQRFQKVLHFIKVWSLQGITAGLTPGSKLSKGIISEKLSGTAATVIYTATNGIAATIDFAICRCSATGVQIDIKYLPLLENA
jgi:hypothetical protein